jgi:hypothetical protein
MFKYSLYFLIVISLFACDDFLDKKPVDQIAADVYFTDEASAESAVRAIYRAMESPYYYGQSLITVPEFAAGHVAHVSNLPEYTNFETNNIRIDNPWVLNIWSSAYSIINAANNVVDQVPQITGIISDAKRAQFVREAKFIRALAYFNLVRSWGDVPLIIMPTQPGSTADYQQPRTPADQIYGQIIADLVDAGNLPDTYGSSLEQNKGRATGGAAKALLAKVYLYRGQYAESAALAKEVMGKGYTLTPTYSSIWLTENSSESIFELQFDAQATNPLATVSNPTNSVLFLAKKEAYDMFEEGDTRRNFTVNFTNSKYYIGKYRNYNPATQNAVIIRLSEVYLIYAEAQARASGSASGEPYDYYKAIRDRAGIDTPAWETLTDVETFVTEVQREKRRELMFEGEAWYDYTRTGLALTEMMTVPDPGRYFFPIPQVEREVNKQLGQNSAYQ